MDYEEITNVVTRERELEMSAAFPVLMRKVYLWMSLALVITGFTAYYVATTPALIGVIITNQIKLMKSPLFIGSPLIPTVDRDQHPYHGDQHRVDHRRLPDGRRQDDTDDLDRDIGDVLDAHHPRVLFGITGRDIYMTPIQ